MVRLRLAGGPFDQDDDEDDDELDEEEEEGA